MSKPLAPISSLLSTSSPLAVIRAIGSIVLDTLQRVILRTLAHVRKESSVVMKPSFAHGYTTPAIVFVVFCAGICASLLHVDPCFVFGAPRASVISVSRQPLAIDFDRETAARIGDSVSQRSSVDNGSFSALTSAMPVTVASIREYGQSSEDFSLQINAFHNTSKYIDSWAKRIQRT
jgi:hypothetical protein